MTVSELAAALPLRFSVKPAKEREIHSVYCCDLMSHAMAHAPPGCAWVTIIGSRNAVAVAVHTGAACIVLADKAAYDADAIAAAQTHGVALFCAEAPIFETACAISKWILNKRTESKGAYPI